MLLVIICVLAQFVYSALATFRRIWPSEHYLLQKPLRYCIKSVKGGVVAWEFRNVASVIFDWEHEDGGRPSEENSNCQVQTCLFLTELYSPSLGAESSIDFPSRRIAPREVEGLLQQSDNS